MFTFVSLVATSVSSCGRRDAAPRLRAPLRVGRSGKSTRASVWSIRYPPEYSRGGRRVKELRINTAPWIIYKTVLACCLTAALFHTTPTRNFLPTRLAHSLSRSHCLNRPAPTPMTHRSILSRPAFRPSITNSTLSPLYAAEITLYRPIFPAPCPPIAHSQRTNYRHLHTCTYPAPRSLITYNATFTRSLFMPFPYFPILPLLTQIPCKQKCSIYCDFTIFLCSLFRETSQCRAGYATNLHAC